MTCAQKLNLAENRLQACQKLGADRPQPNSPTTQVPVKAAGPILVKSGHECMPPNGLPNGDHEEYLGSFNDAAACADMKKALRLAKTLPAKRLDAQLRSDLEVRKDLCNLPDG